MILLTKCYTYRNDQGVVTSIQGNLGTGRLVLTPHKEEADQWNVFIGEKKKREQKENDSPDVGF